MNNPKISIIIPVYNVEKYITKCIYSLLDQTYTNFEAIIVDDGSPDNSIQIAKALVADDPRFIFLEKENGGQGSARNLGIDNAKGEYLAFIDSDDYVEPHYLEKMHQKIIDEDAEICTCHVSIVINSKVTKVIYNDVQRYLDSKDFLLCNNTVTSFSCDKLFKASIFSGMRFDPKIRTYEDSHFIFRLIYGRKITSVNLPLYNYVQREGSTTNSINLTYTEDKAAVMNCYINFTKSLNLNIDQYYLINCYLKNYVYITAVGLARYSHNYKLDICMLLRQLDKKYWSWENIKNLIHKDKKSGLALLALVFSPYLFRVIIKLRDRLVKK